MKSVLAILALIACANATVYDTISNSAAHTTLKTAIDTAGLKETLEGEGPFTVFAPDNEAFAAVEGLDELLKPENNDTLVQLLTYHVLGGKVVAADVTNGYATTVAGFSVQTNVDNGVVTVNDATVNAADLAASNGVVHSIDKVLTVPDVTDLAIGSSIHTTLVAALGAADLVTTLKEAGPYTIFAPTNDAFAAIQDTVDDLLKPENKEQLSAVLLYHVVAGEVKAADVTNAEVETLNGATVTTDVTDGVKVNDASVILADLLGTNGVIHVVDKVLIPPADAAPTAAPTSGAANAYSAVLAAAGSIASTMLLLK